MDCRILIVEDEPRLRAVLCDYFGAKGEEPVPAGDGLAALELAETERFDAVLLDILMPELNGFQVCRALRKHSDVPVIFLTALSDEDDKLRGYELGADDYVTKPFTLSVLYAKTMALIRRNRGSLRQGDRLESGGVSLSLSAHRAYIGARELVLTPKEYELLQQLMRNKNMVLSREQLLVKCWGYDFEGDVRAVDTHVRRLREKLGQRAESLKTVYKAGYRWEG